MNILIPDSWLREFLDTKATPKQIKEYLSLCGPSVERMNTVGDAIVYDVEITSNRPDSMSILGIAREAAAILPRFGIAAKLKKDPYATDVNKGLTLKAFRVKPLQKNEPKKLRVETDPKLNPRWVSVVIDNVSVKPSPKWLQNKLELTGIRPLNTIVDVTNYFMRAYGQPAHAFDYDEIKGGTMTLRASRKGEKLTTLDGKTHTLPGGDIVIEDGSGRLIDLAGIMGGQNSSIKQSTKTIVLFMQTYDPVQIRNTVMSLSHRTEAASLFEKGLDEELVLPTILDAIEMIQKIAGGQIASRLYDLYPKPYKLYTVLVAREKVDAYIGSRLDEKDITYILTPLGFQASVSDASVSVLVPSFRRDIQIDVDIIEEIARIYGYHNIKPTLPDSEPPVSIPHPQLRWEEEIKIRLRDWGYTETYTYSMISEELMDLFGLDKTKAYKIKNPLSEEWVYMRPSIVPSVLQAIKQNANHRSNLKLFELSMTYDYQRGNLPEEIPTLIVAATGELFYELKGIAQALFDMFGIPFSENPTEQYDWYNEKQLSLGTYGSLGVMSEKLLSTLGISSAVTVLELDVSKLVKNVKQVKQYIAIPKYPASYEDLAFVVPERTLVGPMIQEMKNAHPLISGVTLLDRYEQTRTFHITYQSKTKNLTAEDIRPVREKLIATGEKKFRAKFKKG